MQSVKPFGINVAYTIKFNMALIYSHKEFCKRWSGARN